MQLHGQHILGPATSAKGEATFQAINPATGQTLETTFHEATQAEVDQAMRLAEAAFDPLRATSAEQRADLLDAIADQIMALGDALLERTSAETGLPLGRCTAERGRTVNQAKMFADLIREGSWVDARIDHGDPKREPAPKPDLRRMLQPIGPIVAFGASNFPLAISVAGTDTVCALGAGCPVVVKAHPGHPGTCEMLAVAIGKALEQCDMPAGAFSMLHGRTHAPGIALVTHPAAQAVAFTGSLAGGRALYNAAAGRPNPIPVYAEMGSINPVFILPGALDERGFEIADGYVKSVALGVGQFCTNPGLVVGMGGEPLNNFAAAAGRHATESSAATMLHAGIRDAFVYGSQRIAETDGVTTVGQSPSTDAQATQAACAIYSTDGKTYLSNPHLHDEVFGPSSLIVSADTPEQLERIAENLQGHLTATIHGTEADLAEHADLVRILERKVGRLIFNGFPTGVEVCAAQHHGGPYPATTHSHFTSIGTASILRFARPVAYQDWPDAALPIELREANERGIWRMVDGETTK